jgi:DNA-binding Lrp family transcriptional regulator
MSGGLTGFEKRLLNLLQTGLPIAERPYIQVGRMLGVDEATALRRTRGLVKKGAIRRMGASINWRAIGKASTLVTASVPENKLQKVISVVNKFEGVSHNYLREHRYNLWFTLRGDSQGEVDAVLKKLGKRFARLARRAGESRRGIAFHSLPVKRTFKLDVRFDAESGGRRLLPEDPSSLRFAVASGGPVFAALRRGKQKTDKIDKRILEGLQRGLKVEERPYDFLCDERQSIEEVLERIDDMLDRGVIYRVGAVVSHHKLGFTANAMFVCKVCEASVVEAGQKLASCNIVSHCYQRKRFPGWLYNLYGMMHGRSQADIRRVAEKFVRKQGIEKWELLQTAKTLKKK